jgi:hypothetical protein
VLGRRVKAMWAQPWLRLALVLAVAAFFRLWQIGSVPPGLFGDEAADGLDALDVLAGRGAVFFPGNYGREGLHMWILAGTFWLMGISPLAVRLPSAVAGILTALATYWLGRELVAGLASWEPGNPAGWGSGRLASRESGESARGRALPQPTKLLVYQAVHLPISWSTNLPLLAALYLSTSYWHVHFSRFGIRGVFTPLCGALAFAAFWRGVNLGRGGPGARTACSLFWFGLSGFFLGLATYFYTASRFFPLFLVAFLALEALVAWASRRWHEAILCQHWRGLLLLCLVAALVFAPLGYYFVTHPGSFTRRASVVSAARAANPWGQMAQAALANVAQFFVPGHGDNSWNYNLPYRSVFEPLSALLSLIGIAVLLRLWRRPGALFLLSWWPALLLPAVLATDRWPTLPRVLGVIPGVYFFPAIGVSALAALSRLWLFRPIEITPPGHFVPGVGRRRHPSYMHHEKGRRRPTTGRSLQKGDASGEPSAWPFQSPLKGYSRLWLQGTDNRVRTAGGLRSFLPAALVAVCLVVHGGFAYRDYFKVWGPAQETFDAFDGDMVAAWQWMAAHEPVGHVYLSSDIYRHPTYMFLGEHATVTGYFQHANPGLSWFDARGALPLPPAGQPATYLLTAGSTPSGRPADFLAGHGKERACLPAPDGSCALRVVEVPAQVEWESPRQPPLALTDRLFLAGAELVQTAAGGELWLYWCTSGPDPAAWAGYEVEVERGEVPGDGWRAVLSLQSFRPMEWVPAGCFVTWHELEQPVEPAEAYTMRLRLLSLPGQQPVVRPDAPDGWHAIQITTGE